MDHFDVAHMLGHPAFNLLSQSLRVYDELNSKKLLDDEGHYWNDCLNISGRIYASRKNELSLSIQAAILFQAMMEKIPYFVPNIGRGLEHLNMNDCTFKIRGIRWWSKLPMRS